MKKTILAIGLLSSFTCARDTQASVNIIFDEVGGDVIATYTGSIDLTNLGSPGATFLYPNLITDFEFFSNGGGSSVEVYFGSVATLERPTFSGAATISSGSPFTLDPNGVGVSVGYLSGTPFDGSMTFENTSFANLGLTEAEAALTYTTLLTNGDSIIMEFNPVPEPAAYAALMSFLCLSAAVCRRKTSR